MPNDDQPERVWDEHDWERFLQQQDKKTERYMELLERYIDHPNRDQIIAREMGWHHLVNEEGESWADSVDSQFLADLQEQEEDACSEDDGAPGDCEGDGFEVHPLYQSAFALAAWIDQILEGSGDRLANHPAAVRLSTHAAVAGAKLASALSDDDVDEIGMTIAYLKRALHAVTTGIDCAGQLQKERLIEPDQYGVLHHRLFHVRDGIIELMGNYRAEWRRRFEG